MRRTNLLALFVAAVALLAAVWAVYEPYTVRQDAAAVQSQAKSLAQQVGEACARGGQTATELGSACAKAAEVKEAAPVVAQPVAIAPDPAAIRQAARTAVSDYCALNNGCRGSDGTSPNFDAIVTAVVARIPAPKDGRDGENGDAASAVAAYCGQPDGPCRGPAGPGGVNGTNGTNGTNGADGPACPAGYELRDAVITAPDGTTYKGKACVDRNSASSPPSSNPPLPIPTN